jgi:hypothetical protein
MFNVGVHSVIYTLTTDEIFESRSYSRSVATNGETASRESDDKELLIANTTGFIDTGQEEGVLHTEIRNPIR